MMYCQTNYLTKKSLKEAIKSGEKVRLKPEFVGATPTFGTVFVEGPHFPKPHSWYAQCELDNGCIVKIK